MNKLLNKFKKNKLGVFYVFLLACVCVLAFYVGIYLLIGKGIILFFHSITASSAWGVIGGVVSVIFGVPAAICIFVAGSFVIFWMDETIKKVKKIW